MANNELILQAREVLHILFDVSPETGRSADIVFFPRTSLQDVVVRVAAEGGSPSEQLTRLGDELLDVIHRYPDHVWVFLHEFPALTGERAERFRGRRGEYERQVESVLRAGVDSGEFRDLDPWLTARAWFGMHNYTYLWLKPGGRLSARDVAKPFAEIFMRGIERPTRSSTRRTSR